MATSSDRQETYDLSLLDQSKENWESSPGLRAVYTDIFDDLAKYASGSKWLELGSGAGFFKNHSPKVTTSDIRKTPYVDLAVSAYSIQDTETKWDAIFAMDMLHHLTKPFAFFKSASESLSDNGRIILAEPCGTLLGKKFYNVFHHEPCAPAELYPPFEFATDEKGEFANMGMSEALFVIHPSHTENELAKLGLKIERFAYRDLIAYPSTGGLSKSQLLPTPIIRLLLRMEKWIPQSLISTIALRSIIVIQKTGILQ